MEFCFASLLQPGIFPLMLIKLDFKYIKTYLYERHLTFIPISLRVIIVGAQVLLLALPCL